MGYYDVLRQMWYFIVSIPDIAFFLTLYAKTI